MSQTETSEPLTKLSDMVVGTLYHMTADEVDLVIQVVTPGPSPLCIVRGDMQKYLAQEDDSMLVIQFIGWNRFGDSMSGSSALSYFVYDEQPKTANLIGMIYQDKVPSGIETIIVACAPTITQVS